MNPTTDLNPNIDKGFAIVTMVDENAAQTAIRDVNGLSIDGERELLVSDTLQIQPTHT